LVVNIARAVVRLKGFDGRRITASETKFDLEGAAIRGDAERHYIPNGGLYWGSSPPALIARRRRALPLRNAISRLKNYHLKHGSNPTQFLNCAPYLVTKRAPSPKSTSNVELYPPKASGGIPCPIHNATYARI
jgi:hypothetical protein